MALRWSGIVGLLCAWASAVLWSIILTLVQPTTEPAKPWHDLTVGNNAYWARDLRWMALVAGLVALLLVARGEWKRSTVAMLGTASWLALDLSLDRADVAGRAATIRLALGACAVIAIVVAGMSWRAGPPRPGRRVLMFAATVTAVAAPLAGAIESENDTEPPLNPSAFAVGALLALVAIGCALAAAPELSRRRVFVALGLAVASGGGLVLLRVTTPGDRFLPTIAFAGVLLAGITLLRREWPDTSVTWAGYLLMVLATWVAYPFLVVVFLLLASQPLAVAATAFVGNPAVNDADTDVLFSAGAVLTGLVFGGLSLVAGRIRQSTADWRPYSFR
jgi:hypothetical protein